MPAYDYKCPKCGVIELTKKITEPEIKQCPECQSEIKRIYTPTKWLDFEGAFGNGNRF
jgi:putative FmdB family regulatory protein